MTNATEKKADEAQPQNNAQPLFYRNPLPLLQDRHATAGLSSEINYNFAKSTNSIPITLPEFPEVAKHYPIAFTGDAAAVPVAIVGLEDKKNLFVNKTGEWQRNTYIPAYVRRYPFAFTTANDNAEKFILCIDEASDRYVAQTKKKDFAFFEGKEQAQLTKNALAFCTQFHNDYLQTRKFSELLLKHELLTDKKVNIRMADGKQITLAGLRTIDEQKFLNLDEKLVLEWHKNGLLALLNFHFLSATNWPKVADLLDKKQ